jgi:hypothetical protein
MSMMDLDMLPPASMPLSQSQLPRSQAARLADGREVEAHAPFKGTMTGRVRLPVILKVLANGSSSRKPPKWLPPNEPTLLSSSSSRFSLCKRSISTSTAPYLSALLTLPKRKTFPFRLPTSTSATRRARTALRSCLELAIGGNKSWLAWRKCFEISTRP